MIVKVKCVAFAHRGMTFPSIRMIIFLSFSGGGGGIPGSTLEIITLKSDDFFLFKPKVSLALLHPGSWIFWECIGILFTPPNSRKSRYRVQ